MAGMQVVVVACDDKGNIDVVDLEQEGATARRSAGGAARHLSLDARRVRGRHPGHLPHRARARRAGLHGRRQHERAGRADQPGGDRRRRLPHQPAQDVRHPARRRRPRHGADLRRRAPGAVPAGPSGGEDRRRQGDPRGVGGAVGQCLDPADLVRLHRDARPRRPARRDGDRDPQRQLRQGAARAALPDPLHAHDRPRRARDDRRPAAAQGRRRASTRPTSPSG